MVKPSNQKVAARYLEAMPKLLRGVPDDYDWGFFSNEDPRMHLQTLGRHLDEYKIWLEEQGRRVVEPDGRVPAKILNAVRTKLSEDRHKIENQWVKLMLGKGWIRLQVQGERATLTAYPGMSHSFRRTVDLTEHGSPGTYATAHDVKLSEENAALVLGARLPESEQVYISLSRVLWVG